MKREVKEIDPTLLAWRNGRGEDERHLVWTDSDAVSGELICLELSLIHRDGYWQVALREYDSESYEFHTEHRGTLSSQG